MVATFEVERSIGVLVIDVARLLRRELDRRAQPLGLTQAQWRAIVNLSRAEGMKQAELAERLEVKPITIARLIDRMELAGWVERRADPCDRRAMRLYLTPKSAPILAQMQDLGATTLEEALNGVSATARKHLASSLLKMKKNLSPEEGAASNANRHSRTNRDDRTHE